MDDISGKTAFITGGASGIGFGMARAFLAAGLKVAIADIRQDHLDHAAAEIGDDLNALFLRLDVTDRAAMNAVADEVESKLGPVQILCNNAGVGVLGDVKAMTFDDWDWTLEVNIGGGVNGVQTFLPRMLARAEGGHIVNTSSIGGMLRQPIHRLSVHEMAGLRAGLTASGIEPYDGPTEEFFVGRAAYARGERLPRGAAVIGG